MIPKWIINPLSQFVQTFLIRKFPQNFIYTYFGIVSVIMFRYQDDCWVIFVTEFLTNITRNYEYTEQPVRENGCTHLRIDKRNTTRLNAITVYICDFCNISLYFPSVYLTTLLVSKMISRQTLWWFVSNILQ